MRFRKCVVKAQPLIGHFWGQVGGVSRGVYLSTRTSRNNLLFAVAKAGEGKIGLYLDLHHLKALLSENCLCKQILSREEELSKCPPDKAPDL